MSRTSKLTLVEFFGVPGVGKSYLLKRLVPPDAYKHQDKYYEGSRVKRIRRKILLVLKHFSTAIPTAFLIGRVIALYSQKGVLRRCKVLFNWLFIDSLIREVAQSRHSVLALDQGIAQALWSTNFGAVQEPPFEKVYALLKLYLETLPELELTVVRVTAPFDLILHRLAGREGLSPLDTNINRLQEAFLAERKAIALIEHLCDIDINKTHIAIVNVENNASTPEISLSSLWHDITSDD